MANLNSQRCIGIAKAALRTFELGGTSSGAAASKDSPAIGQTAFADHEDIEPQTDRRKAMEDLMADLSDSVGYAVQMYKLSAKLCGDVRINASVATGGRIEGPSLGPLIRNAPMVATVSGWRKPLVEAAAAGIGGQWTAMTSTMRVPGLPWYPSFASYPGPQAPLTPNVPCPFIMLGPNVDACSAASLKSAMSKQYKGKVKNSNQFFEALAEGVAAAIATWVSAQMLTNVMGHGPVPSYAPPAVRAGPVVNGTIIPSPNMVVK